MGRVSEGEEWLDRAEMVESSLGTNWCKEERRKREPRTPGQVMSRNEGRDRIPMKGRIKGLNGAELGDDYTLLLAWARIKVADGLIQDADDILDLASKRFNTEPKVWIAKGKNWERRDRKKALGYYKRSLVLGSGVEGLVKVAKVREGGGGERGGDG